MRGKVIKTKSVIFSTGITPAYAGKSCQQNGYDFLFQDHPRLCGEKGNRKRVCPAFCRITPAYAGKSSEVVSLFYGRKDHPRLCGEKRIA